MKCLLLHGNSAAREDEIYELPQTLVEKWFVRGRYARMGTIGDGSCFYHSICRAMNVHNYATASYPRRRQIAAALRIALSRLYTQDDHDSIQEKLVGSPKMKTCEQIKTMMLDSKVWAEETMIRFASKALELNVVFLNLGNNVNTMYCGIHDTATSDSVKKSAKLSRPTVVVAWIDNSHFELVVRIESVNSEDVCVKTHFNPEDDSETIRNLMSRYIQKCQV